MGAVFGAADGLQSLTLLYDTRERSSQSLAVTKRWTVLSPAASFFLAKKEEMTIYSTTLDDLWKTDGGDYHSLHVPINWNCVERLRMICFKPG